MAEADRSGARAVPRVDAGSTHRANSRSSPRDVLLTDAAARDLDELYAAAFARGGPTEATQILDRIQVLVDGLAEETLTEAPLPELSELGILSARQHVTADGLRVVYRPSEESVTVVLLAPLGRSFQSLLERRLLDA